MEKNNCRGQKDVAPQRGQSVSEGGADRVGRLPRRRCTDALEERDVTTSVATATRQRQQESSTVGRAWRIQDMEGCEQQGHESVCSKP